MASAGLKIEIKGLAELTRKLEGRIRRMEQGILRKACQAFAEPIRKDAESRARSLISRDAKIITEIRIRGTTATVKIGSTKEDFFLFFFEYGYWIRKERKGPGITFVAARPIMRPAYDAHHEEGLRAMEKILVDAFSEEVQIDAPLAA